MLNKLSAALLCSVMVTGAFAEVTFDQRGSVTEIVKQLQNVSPDAENTPLPGDPKAPAKWTIMVYVNAKNNLETYGLKDVNEMEMIGSTPDVNIVAELGRINGYATNDGDWKGSRRYLVQKDADSAKITSPVLMEILKSDMGKWENMVEFVKWSKERFPAQHYVLIVWNHGSGWNKKSEEEGKGISYDDETGSHITTQQLALSLQAVGKIDILSMDACLMQMMEVAYEARKGAEYIVASEETGPGDGYTYDTFLGPLAAKPSMGSAELSKLMVDAYTDHYQQINQGATQSSVNTASLEKLAKLTDEWTAAVMATGNTAAAVAARSKAQAFYYSSNKDLYHFVKLVNDATADAAVKAKGAELLEYLKGSVIYHNRWTGAKYANSSGLAIYIPSSYTAAYDGLAWAKDSNWDVFMKWIK